MILSFQDYSRNFGDTINGVKEIKAFNLYKFKENEFLKSVDETINLRKKLEFNSLLNGNSNQILIQILISILYIVGANEILNLRLSIGSIFAFITYSTYVTSPISAIINIKYYLSGIIPSTKRYIEFISLEKETGENKINLGIEGKKITFENVDIGYNKNNILINDICLEIKEKEKIILIGKNGCGKTTFINTLLRFYDNISGVIKIDNVNIKDIDLNYYRDLFSVVSQDIYLFNDTIKNNICLYEEIPNEKIEQVLIDTNLQDFISKFGLDYVVGDNGCMLSGGQKQKIALARALIKDRPILIFDEATSNIDNVSEVYINSLLESKLKDKIVIIITHKINTIKNISKTLHINNNNIN